MLLYRKETFMCGPSFRESFEDDERRADRWHRKPTKWWSKTVHWPLARWQRTWTPLMNLFKTFCLMICLWDAKKDRICWKQVRRGRTMPSFSATLWPRTERVIQELPNSTDLAPCDFFLFNRLNKSLRG